MAQMTNLGVPYVARSIVLGLTVVVALIYMRDPGFEADHSQTIRKQIKTIFKASIENGLRQPAVRWVMLATPFAAGAGFFAFYAMQPYLLEL